VPLRRSEPASHVIVEPVAEVASLLDAQDPLAAQLCAAVREQARRVLARHGSCRVLCDLHAPRPCWHVFAPER
jgi:hypothetical protein